MNRAGTHHDFRKQVELTARQRQVMDLLARGYTNGEIGQALGISLDGAKWHVSEIIGKLRVSSREEAVAYWNSYNRPAARLSRVFQGIAPIAVLQWGAAGVAAIAAAAGVVVAMVAYGGGGSDTPGVIDDPTATATATAPAAVTGTPSPGVTPTPAVSPTPAPPEATTALQVFFMRGEHVAAVYREVPETQSVGRAALEQLLAGPDAGDLDTGLTSAVPEGVSLLGLNIAQGIATVDLSAEFEAGGGTLMMQTRLAQVVYTLTQFPTVDAVVFHIDGEVVEVFSGEGILLDGPVGREDFENVTPAISLHSPAQWETVSSPVRLIGTANTFEATFQVAIVDNSGLIIAEQTLMATSGSGERGTFDVTIPFDLTREGIGSIIVFEYSAQDGSQINVVEVPVRFEE